MGGPEAADSAAALRFPAAALLVTAEPGLAPLELLALLLELLALALPLPLPLPLPLTGRA